MRKKWNSNDFQGRSEEHMERNYRVFAFLLMLSWLVGTGLVLYALINYIF
jgi:hypothetical protein